METLLSEDFEEKIRQFEEEQKQINAAAEIQEYNNPDDTTSKEGYSYFADWHVQ